MAKMVDAALAKAMVFAARWLSAVVLSVFVFGWSASVSARPVVDLSRQAATGGAAVPQSCCSTAWACA